ncbi:MFS transporter [Pontibacillus marinus]|uniref:Major facilitator superfamily (MFS) profile domain-containing protein n=1 Tax=Pontibacillus marinus BH030004 = DSM 16465 TaxID=1385511 RepID=A0A0A5FVF8_9BACI|nr:MFS transporter [Pontibacillus marinus]KGX83904.1 hypothetical protein N783_20645 [Pontibacillus marinus BH030004 = DSM 16465]
MSKQAVMATVLVLTGIFIASNLYTMLPLHTGLAETFGVSIPVVSLSSSLFIFPYAIGLFFFGMLADKLPHKTLLLCGMSLLTIVTTLIGFVDVFWLFICLRALQGILAASFAPTAFAYTFEHFQGRLQAFVIAMINTGFLFAGIFGQMVSAAIADLFAYPAVFFSFGLFYFLCLVGMKTGLVKSKPKTYTKLFSLSPILSFFRHRPLQKLYGIAFFLLFTVMLFYGSFELFMYRDELDFPFSLQTFRMIGLIGIIPAFFAGRLKSAFGARGILAVHLGLMAVGFIVPLVALNVWTLLFASICMIASTALTIPMVILLVGVHGAHARASAVSIYSFTLLTGASVGSWIAALLPFEMVLVSVVVLFCGLVVLSMSVRNEVENDGLREV